MTEALKTFEFAVDGVAAGAFWVLGFEAREALSEPTWMTVEAATGVRVDVDAIIGRAAHLTIFRADGSTRAIHGVVMEASLDAQSAEVFRFVATVASRDAALALGRDSRIFQEKTVPEIVKRVFDLAGLTGDACAWELTGRYRPHANVTQFNEPDLTFAARILAEEGIFYAVRQGERAETIAFLDGAGAYAPVDEAETLLDRDATQTSENVVWDLRDERTAGADALVLRDYDPAHPSLDLTVSERAAGSTGREVYLHPGGYREPSPGRSLARRVLARMGLRRRVIAGSSDVPHLAPARTFTVASHPREALNAELVVVEVIHRGFTGDGGGRYSNTFRALPRDTAFVPAPVPAPVVGGQHVAFVTTPQGGEIHTDDRARVKVRFPWDRSGLTDDRSSTWCRVGQLALGGSMILPRGGFEVLVDYEFGDIDRPMVAGHLYNGAARAPYELPASATRSSIQTATTAGGPGANELRFEDGAGAEEVFLNASKDLTVSVDHDASWEVTADVTRRVGSRRTLRVGNDLDARVTGARQLSVGGNQSISVTARTTENVGGSLTLSVGGMRKVQVGGDLAEETTGSLTRTVGSLQSITGLKGYQRVVAGASTTTVAALWTQLSGTSSASACSGARSQTIGALKLVKAKQISLDAKAAIVSNVAALVVKSGGGGVDDAKGAVAITAGGGLSVKASGISVTATSSITVIAGGCLIKMSSSGRVTVKAATIDLSGAKALGQVMHRSN